MKNDSQIVLVSGNHGHAFVLHSCRGSEVLDEELVVIVCLILDGKELVSIDFARLGEQEELSIESSDFEAFEEESFLEMEMDFPVQLVDEFEDVEEDVARVGEVLEDGYHDLHQTNEETDVLLEDLFLVDDVHEFPGGQVSFLLIRFLVNHQLHSPVEQRYQELFLLSPVGPPHLVEEEDDPHVVQQMEVEVNVVVLEVSVLGIVFYFFLKQPLGEGHQLFLSLCVFCFVEAQNFNQIHPVAKTLLSITLRSMVLHELEKEFPGRKMFDVVQSDHQLEQH